MKLPTFVALGAMLATCTSAQTVYLAGDSTMAKNGGGGGNSDGEPRVITIFILLTLLS